jgi:hypothetical protein
MSQPNCGLVSSPNLTRLVQLISDRMGPAYPAAEKRNDFRGRELDRGGVPVENGGDRSRIDERRAQRWSARAGSHKAHPLARGAERKIGAGKRRSRPSADRVSIHLPESAEPVAHGRATPQAPVDKSKLALNEPRRYRNRAHLELVASQPCLICERRPSDAHHLRFAQPSALGRRVSDEFTVPLCRSYHRALHRRGDEAEWWRENGIDPVGIAQKLWERARLGNLAATRAVPFPPI